MMQTIKITERLSNEEKEIHIYLDPVDKVWIFETFMPKYFRKALKQGWTPIKQYVYEDGTVCGMVLTGPERSITIRNVEQKKMSEKQLNNLLGDDSQD